VSSAAVSGSGNSRTAQLTRRLAARDEAAFRDFHELYFSRLHRFLIVVTLGQEQDAEEALQETFLRVVRHAREFEDELEFWCWLKAVARSAARDGGRKRRRYLALLARFTQRQVPRVTPPELEDSKLLSALAESLDELPVHDRRLLEQKYFEGAQVRELAAASGISEKAMESRLLRLRRDLKTRLLRKLSTL
jgi:RNA polymerase sigma-70 factor (ECF subfamily)